MGAIVTLVIVVLLILLLGFRVVQQYERGVVFRLGRVRPNEKQPGPRVIIPLIDRMRKVDMRVITMPINSQAIITKDNVTVDVAAVAYYNIENATKAIVEVASVTAAISQIAQTTVRNIVGQHSLDEVLSEMQSINADIKVILDEKTERWGVVVSLVEIRDIQLPDSMQRAMARQAEAEREKRAKIIAAEGEQLSAAKLSEAADIIGQHPVALQLRNLQVLGEIAAEKNSTIVFPAQFMDSVEHIKSFVAREA